jgi:hypothetical protein
MQVDINQRDISFPLLEHSENPDIKSFGHNEAPAARVPRVPAARFWGYACGSREPDRREFRRRGC